MKNLNEHPVMKKITTDINENKILSNLQEEYNILELLSFNEFNIGDKLRDNAYLVEQFRLMSVSEKNKLKKLENKINEKAGELYDYYKYKNSRDLTKIEIERYYLVTDKELNKLKKIYLLQELRVGFFDAAFESFKSQGFNMRNFIENLKIGG